MDWITDQIAIGTKFEALDPELRRQHGIQSVLSLDGTHWEQDARELGLAKILEIPLRDGSGNDPNQFRLAIESLSELVQSHAPVLVHCHLGQNRSPAVVAGYLMQTNGIRAFAALRLVAAKRAIQLRPPLEDLLCSL